MPVALKGQASLWPVSAILFMDANDTENKGFAAHKYKDNFVPILDAVYFVSQLDSCMTKFLKTKDLSSVIKNDTFYSVTSGIITECPLPASHHGQTFYSLNSVFCNNIINDQSDARIKASSYQKGQEEVRKIVDAELSRNNDVLNSLMSLKIHDECAHAFISKHRDEEGFDKWLANDEEFVINYYRNTGVKLVNPIVTANWDFVRDDAIKALYCEYVTMKGLDKIVSVEEFFGCVVAALKETENNLQFVQRPQQENHD